MNALATIIDPYTFRARLQPVLVAVAPVVLCALALAPTAWEPLRSALLVAGSLGGAFLLGQIARDAGRGIEPRLYDGWGGKPSVAMLRHRDGRIPSETKRRYHNGLSTLLERGMPTIEEENAEPERADLLYEAASAWLIANTRDTAEFRVLFAENVEYGFRRNLLGVRAAAIIMAVASLAVIAVAHLFAWPWGLPAPGTAAIVSAIIIGYITVLSAVVRRSWVRLAAEAYATRLLEAIDRIRSR